MRRFAKVVSKASSYVSKALEAKKRKVFRAFFRFDPRKPGVKRSVQMSESSLVSSESTVQCWYFCWYLSFGVLENSANTWFPE